MKHEYDERVDALMREVADAVVMPRYQALSDDQITEKTPDELVTVADSEAELRLTEGLLAIEDARIIGEEAAAADPSLLEHAGDGRVWIIDPIDSTANFVAGHSPFALMIGLADDGVTKAGWIFDPVTRRMCHAHAGQGAFINDERVSARVGSRRRPIAALMTRFFEPEERRAIEGRAQGTYELTESLGCAAEHYPRLCLGQTDVLLFKRTLPWDHAPGALFANEAGARVSRWDGSDYWVGDGKTGLLATSSPAMWDEAAAVLFG